jgi:hypothetical protein
MVQCNKTSTIGVQRPAITVVDTTRSNDVRSILPHAEDERWTPAEEKNLVRKIDMKLMPILMITYGLQYYDKVMISQAVIRCNGLQIESR